MRLKPPLLLIAILVTIATGCNSPQPTSIDKSQLEYHNSQWILSEMWAKKSIDEHEHVDEAQYMMGLCEFRLENLENSKLWFEQAAGSDNPEVHGKATAMLGIIVLSEGDYESAAAIFAEAAAELEGSDQQEALSRMTSPSTSVSTATSTQFFTLQFGAYRNKVNANNAVESLTQTLQKVHLGTAWIVKETDRLGRTMFLVHAGRFSSRITASRRKSRGDLPQCIVAVSHR